MKTFKLAWVALAVSLSFSAAAATTHSFNNAVANANQQRAIAAKADVESAHQAYDNAKMQANTEINAWNLSRSTPGYSKAFQNEQLDRAAAAEKARNAARANLAQVRSYAATHPNAALNAAMAQDAVSGSAMRNQITQQQIAAGASLAVGVTTPAQPMAVPNAVPHMQPQSQPQAPQLLPQAVPNRVPQPMTVPAQPQTVPQAIPQVQQLTPQPMNIPQKRVQAIPNLAPALVNTPQITGASYRAAVVAMQQVTTGPATPVLNTVNVSVTSLKPSTPVSVTINGVTVVTTAGLLTTVAPEIQVAKPMPVTVFGLIRQGNSGKGKVGSHQAQSTNNNGAGNANASRNGHGQRSGHSAANNI